MQLARGCDRRRLVPLLWRLTVFIGVCARARACVRACARVFARGWDRRAHSLNCSQASRDTYFLTSDVRARCAVLAAVFPAAYEMHRNHYERHVIAWFVGGVFAGLAVLLAVHQILQHLIYYRQPRLQKVRNSNIDCPESPPLHALSLLSCCLLTVLMLCFGLRSMLSESLRWSRSTRQMHGSDCGTNRSLYIWMSGGIATKHS